MNIEAIDGITASPVNLSPTRRLSTKAGKVFARVLTQYSHLKPSDAEALTQYAEASDLNESNSKACKRQPTIAGYRGATKRNPACIERDRAQTAMRRLEGSLLLGVKYDRKRMDLATRRARQQEAQSADESRPYDIDLIVEDEAGYQTQCWEEDFASYPVGSPCHKLLLLTPAEREALHHHLL